MSGLDWATLLERLPCRPADHTPRDKAYGRLQTQLAEEVAARFGSGEAVPVALPPFGDIVFPLIEMGNINSLDLFGLDELILFAFYWRNRGRYRNVADFGTNLGLHSLVMDRCGYTVRAFEPDPRHLEILRQTLARNDCRHVTVHAAAVSTQEGSHEFTRVLGNTTGSHLTGAKADPYGDLERFPVQLVDALPHIAWADLVKMDIEGHEAEVLCATEAALWQGTDLVVEVGSPDNADRIFAHFADMPVNLFAQKIAWQLVECLEDMPTSHRDGSLFISVKDAMPWV